ncbi:PssD/Cps14F family polysaccharide biosynthesis glycosyltransferase [Clostridium sp. AL.422]|uniref:PssD/Cps14F family polysaccharide biosynthesis glycosyltransferase n=1 Tax=Clostridium TaxID=1485 RepID=UPI00293DEC7D|nr:MULTISPECIES: PssD/Cps14F family polysaccharide biosynthesis glycosyltransferase [unclassified Clostridium]MDV4150431.1 PssD/Cps14F family polysaccharide biosynthesis glycosyltransferase [Clostridium sp. AL.422]
MKKICFIASTGGHLDQLMMLSVIMEKYNSFIVTEKTTYSTIKSINKMYYIHQVNRAEKLWTFKMMINTFISIYIFLIQRPDLVISTGALATIPMCLISKVFRKKLIFIESFAKINTPTLTGKLLYKFADEFYVQWEDMIKVYPKAVYKGGIY